MNTDSELSSKIWHNYYEVQETAKSDLLHKQISFLPSEETNILTYPYSCIGLIKYNNTSRGVSLNGTAFLIDSDLIVTSADNIYSKQDQCFYKDFYFYPPTFNKNELPIKVREYRISQAYIKTQKHDHLASVSLALMKLDRPVYRNQYMQLKYGWANEQSHICLYGYPKPLCGQRLFGREGRITKIKQTIIVHSVLTQPGQAGSPIMVHEGSRWYVIGIQYGYSNHYGIGLLFTKDIVMKICKWEREMLASRLRISPYLEEKEHTPYEHFTFRFHTKSVQMNPQLTNWHPLQVKWETNPDDTDKVIINNNKIIRKQVSFFDNRHKQATTIVPLSKQGKYTIKVKIIKYGNQQPYDTIYFGLISQKHKKKQYSDGRHKGAVAYLTMPDNIQGNGDVGRGAILMDGVQVAYGQDLFLYQGDEVKMELNMQTSELTFTNKKRSVTVKVSSHYAKKQIFLFASLSSHDSCVSWHSTDGQVWL